MPLPSCCALKQAMGRPNCRWGTTAQMALMAGRAQLILGLQTQTGEVRNLVSSRDNRSIFPLNFNW